MLAQLASPRFTAPTDRLPRLRARDRAGRRARRGAPRRPVRRSSGKARAAVAGRHRPARRALIPVITLAVDGTHPGRCSAAPTWSTTSRWCSRRCSSSRATSSCCCRPTTSPRATTGRASTTSCSSSSVLGMTVMASARDLISIFIALELLSIPAYMLAAWRKRDLKGNEAGMKYYLMGVFASAVMLYGMSLLYGVTGSTRARRHRRQARRRPRRRRPAHHAGHRVRDRRLRLQGVGRAVPHLGARHLRGRAHPGHRVPRRRVEGRRLRGPADADLRRLPPPPRRVPAAHVGARRASR